MGVLAATSAVVPTVTPPDASQHAVTVWSHNPAFSTGPHSWRALNPGWVACGDRRGQSPVVVTATRNEQLPALRIEYPPEPLIVENTGHGVEVQQPVTGAGILTVGDRSYRLLQWHIHAPAEHVINGKRADLEIHLVHADDQRQTAVLALFATIGAQPGEAASGAAAKLLRTVIRGAPDAAGRQAYLGRTLSAADLLAASATPAGRSRAIIGTYFSYTGSLTTPPCSGGVRWFLRPQSITIDAPAVRHLHRLVASSPGYEEYPDNNRPVQPIGDRVVVSRVDGSTTG